MTRADWTGRTFRGSAGLAILLSISGCHSAFVNAQVINQSGQALRLIEVDYPSASFGTEDLAAGATFKYRFKILGSGATKLSWTDSHEKDHTSPGPTLHEGQEGTLTVTIGPDTATWNSELQH